MKLVTSITFCFANGEFFSIDEHCIGTFRIKSVRNVLRENYCCLTEFDETQKINIEIFSEANTKFYSTALGKDITVFDRLLKNDMLRIVLNYDDNSSTPLNSYWPDRRSSPEINQYQKSMVSKLGNLYITIGEGTTINKTFSLEKMNNEEIVNKNKEKVHKHTGEMRRLEEERRRKHE